MTKPDYKKITQALNYIAEKDGGEINYMKALKLLYLSERLHLREYGRLITDDNLIAMKNGTLGSQAKDVVTVSDHLPHVAYKYVQGRIKRQGRYDICTTSSQKNELSKTDVECVDKIFSVLGDKTQYELADLTHELPEWKRHRYEIEEEGVAVINLDVMDLFKSSDDRNLEKVYSQSNAQLELSRDLFLESLEQKVQLA